MAAAAKSESAADACKKISSRADEITAQWKGASLLVDSALGIFSPNNYKSSTDASQAIRTNLNIDMSTSDVENIRDSCANSSSVDQTNIIDCSSCDYCQQHGCDITNVTQTNNYTSNQVCTLVALQNKLLQKVGNVDAAATAEVIQRASGLAKTNFSSDVCTNINQNMSSTQFYTNIASCSNADETTQTNTLKGCGSCSGVLQQNISSKFQQCLLNTTDSSKITSSSAVKETATSKADQSAQGINLTKWMVIAAIAFVIIVLVGFAMSGSHSSTPPAQASQ
jgi:hypothetical protein